MKHLSFLAAAVSSAAFLASPVLAADELINKPEAGWTIYGKQTNKRVKDPSTVQFNTAKVAIEVKAQGGGNPWEAAAQSDITGPVKAGDTVLGAIWMRSVKDDGSPASVTMQLQINTAPYSSYANKTVSVGTEWKLYDITAVADKDYDKGTTVLVVHLNAAKQTVYLGPGFVVKTVP